jgi:hypothetical protein
METYIVHILESSICLALFYLMYVLLFRSENGFKFIRFFLLTSMVLSLLLPFNRFSLHIIPAIEKIQPLTPETEVSKKDLVTAEVQPSTNNISGVAEKTRNYPLLLTWVYFSGLAVILIRFVIGMMMVFVQYRSSSKEIQGNLVVLKNEKLNSSFSFFHLIFISPKGVNDDEIKSILAHENIHVSQHHTIDLILIELVAAAMWFNPVIWYLRKSLIQVHEYLADEGVLKTGFDRLEYQALLVNQVAEGRLLSLASGFKQSVIKKRIIMMTKIKSDSRNKLKLISLVPVTAVLLFSIACINGQNKKNANNAEMIMPLPPPPPVTPTPPPDNSGNKESTVGAIAPTRMNVFYLGVDNPLEISISGQKSEELEVTTDNGKIEGSNGSYTIRPVKTGRAVVTVFAKGKKVKESEFRVKIVPDPVAKVAGKNGGTIKKSVLMSQEGVTAEMENFDFDLSFKVTEFTISTIDNGYVIESTSHSDKFTPEQRNLIQKLPADSGKNIYFQDIKAQGPDGTTRKLSTVNFRIKEKL